METPGTETKPRSDLLTENLLWGSPRTSDAAFVVSMRSRLNRQPMGVWVSTRKTAFAFGLACLLLLGVWYPANRDNVSLTADLETLDEAVSDFAYDEVDPAELADFLGVSEDFGSTSLETDLSPVGVSTAELLELEQQEFEYVLSELQETNFF